MLVGRALSADESEEFLHKGFRLYCAEAQNLVADFCEAHEGIIPRTGQQKFQEELENLISMVNALQEKHPKVVPIRAGIEIPFLAPKS